MNKKELALKRRKVWYSYHIPGMGNLDRLKMNVVFLSAANSWEHEMKKCEICYNLLKEGKKFLTEAELNKKVDGKKVRRDVVCLDDGGDVGYVYEIETTPERAVRFLGQDVEIVPVGWEFNDAKWIELKEKVMYGKA